MSVEAMESSGCCTVSNMAHEIYKEVFIIHTAIVQMTIGSNHSNLTAGVIEHSSY